MHTVQIRHIYSSFVGKGVVLAMFINVECKKDHIDPIYVLEHNNTFAPVRKFIWIVLMSISGFHEFPHFMFSVGGRYLTNGKRAACRKGFECFLVRDILGRFHQ
jgi:hypothetical protein